MCTRFFIEPESPELREITEKVRRSPLAMKYIKAGSAILGSGEIRPTNVVPVIAPNKAGRAAVYPMKWGFQIPGRSLVVNARTETAGEKPTFRESWARRRCAVPASWYYEWEHLIGNSGQKKTGAKYMIQPRGASVTWLCGLYRIEDGLPVFTILTREPAGELWKIHDRMPFILPENRVARWIRPDTKPEDLLQYALTDMICEKSL